MGRGPADTGLFDRGRREEAGRGHHCTAVSGVVGGELPLSDSVGWCGGLLDCWIDVLMNCAVDKFLVLVRVRCSWYSYRTSKVKVKGRYEYRRYGTGTVPVPVQKPGSVRATVLVPVRGLNVLTTQSINLYTHPYQG